MTDKFGNLPVRIEIACRDRIEWRRPDGHSARGLAAACNCCPGSPSRYHPRRGRHMAVVRVRPWAIAAPEPLRQPVVLKRAGQSEGDRPLHPPTVRPVPRAVGDILVAGPRALFWLAATADSSGCDSRRRTGSGRCSPSPASAYQADYPVPLGPRDDRSGRSRGPRGRGIPAQQGDGPELPGPGWRPRLALPLCLWLAATATWRVWIAGGDGTVDAPLHALQSSGSAFPSGQAAISGHGSSAPDPA